MRRILCWFLGCVPGPLIGPLIVTRWKPGTIYRRCNRCLRVLDASVIRGVN